MKILKSVFSGFNFILLAVSLILLISSILHKSQLISDPEQYKRSILIAIELIAMVGLMILHFYNLIRIGIYFFGKEYANAGAGMLCGFCSFVMLISALLIDVLALIYMT